jgi:hypothetical protein
LELDLRVSHRAAGDPKLLRQLTDGWQSLTNSETVGSDVADQDA